MRNRRKALDDNQQNVVIEYINVWTDQGDWEKYNFPSYVVEELIGGTPPGTLAVLASGNVVGVEVSKTYDHIFGFDLFREDLQDCPYIINTDHYEGYRDKFNGSILLIGPNIDLNNKKDFRVYHHKFEEFAPIEAQELVRSTYIDNLSKALGKRIDQLDED